MEKSGVVNKGGIGLVCLAFLLWAGYAFAQPDLADLDEVGQITEALSISGVPLTVSGPLQLTVLVDQGYCGTGGAQCMYTGHSKKAAAKINHNPVRIMLQVLDEMGKPIVGIASDSFTVLTPFVPSGGPGLTRLVCSDCFQESPEGVYAVFVHPSPAGNWKSGSYCFQVHVTVGSISGYAVALIAIPF